MKWYGQIGFEEDAVEVAPGMYEPPSIVVRNYFGDVLRHRKSFDNSQIVTDFNISNQISVLSDEYLRENLHKIVYVTFNGSKWRVNSVDISWPRLTIDLGGAYKDGGGSMHGH